MRASPEGRSHRRSSATGQQRGQRAAGSGQRGQPDVDSGQPAHASVMHHCPAGETSADCQRDRGAGSVIQWRLTSCGATVSAAPPPPPPRQSASAATTPRPGHLSPLQTPLSASDTSLCLGHLSRPGHISLPRTPPRPGHLPAPDTSLCPGHLPAPDTSSVSPGISVGFVPAQAAVAARCCI